MAEFTEVIKQRNRMCDYIAKTKGCEECILYSENNVQNVGCDVFLFTCPEEAEKIIMGWAAVHPTMTNAEKFREVFGFEPDTSMAMCPYEYEEKCQATLCDMCSKFGFWGKEYKEPEGNRCE